MTSPLVHLSRFASRFSTPLSIVSLSITVLYILYRIVLEKSDLDLLEKGEIYVIIDKIITYLFILALVGLVLGIGAYVATRIGRFRGKKRARKPGETALNDPYDYLKWESVWEIRDPEGRRVDYSRSATIRFLQPNVNVITDRVWGDGETMHNYHCSLGVPSDIFDYGDSKRVVISLRENRRKGSLARYTLSRTILNGFGREEEWIEEGPGYYVKDYTLRVIFPKNRACRRAVITRRQVNVTEELSREAYGLTADGRQEVVVSFKGLDRETILLRWWW